MMGEHYENKKLNYPRSKYSPQDNMSPVQRYELDAEINKMELGFHERLAEMQSARIADLQKTITVFEGLLALIARQTARPAPPTPDEANRG